MDKEQKKLAQQKRRSLWGLFVCRASHSNQSRGGGSNRRFLPFTLGRLGHFYLCGFVGIHNRQHPNANNNPVAECVKSFSADFSTHPTTAIASRARSNS